MRIIPVEIIQDQYPSFQLPPSKSVYNRHRVLYHLAKEKMPFPTKGLPADCTHLDLALNSFDEDVYLGQGGTTLRFYLASRLLQNYQVKIQVDEQLKSRPIHPLLDSLEQLGLCIERGWPLHIKPAKKIGNKVFVNASDSSQFVSALALVGAFLENGLAIDWEENLASKSFFELTLRILSEWQIEYTVSKQSIHIKSGFKIPEQPSISGDWASASYVIMGAALRKQSVYLNNLVENTGQPDEELKTMLAPLGIKLKSLNRGMLAECTVEQMKLIQKDFTNCPDLAPTLCIWHLLKGIPIWFTGLNTLNKKESQRLNKLAELLKDMKLDFSVTADSLFCEVMNPTFPEKYEANTEGDHRLAMAFSDLCLKIPDLKLSEVQSVEKSYPQFWEEMRIWKIISK